jgi:eukaryotic-like serine/threonine-protein kinase
VRHQLVSQLYHEALARPGEDERSAFLLNACSSDPDLQREVEELLVAHEHAAPFMATPAIEIAAASHVIDEISFPRACGHYTMESLLGRGGMGEVYLARDTTLGRCVALKVLRYSHTSDARSVQRFEQEARAASSLNHPNIVTIYEIGEMVEGRFIAMELIEGQSLSALIGHPCPVGRLAPHRPSAGTGSLGGSHRGNRASRHQARERHGARRRVCQAARFRRFTPAL